MESNNLSKEEVEELKRHIEQQGTIQTRGFGLNFASGYNKTKNQKPRARVKTTDSPENKRNKHS